LKPARLTVTNGAAIVPVALRHPAQSHVLHLTTVPRASYETAPQWHRPVIDWSFGD
jgi:hypothetical protein